MKVLVIKHNPSGLFRSRELSFLVDEFYDLQLTCQPCARYRYLTLVSLMDYTTVDYSICGSDLDRLFVALEEMLQSLSKNTDNNVTELYSRFCDVTDILRQLPKDPAAGLESIVYSVVDIPTGVSGPSRG